VIDPLKPDTRPSGGSAVTVDPTLPHVFGRHSDGQMVCAHCDQPPDNEIHTRFAAQLLAHVLPLDARQQGLDILIEHFASVREYWDQKQSEMEERENTEHPGYHEVSAIASTYDEVIDALRLMRDIEVDDA
jgi:hypothetical protein